MDAATADRLRGIASDVRADGLDAVVRLHGRTRQAYVDADLIAVEYGLTGRQAQLVKSLLEQDSSVDEQLAAIQARRRDAAADQPHPAAAAPPDEWEPSAWRDAVADTDAPPSATLTEKPINGSRYYYLQWSRDGTRQSAYVGPVTP